MTTPEGSNLEEEEEQVMSEVHLGCPPNFSRPFISRFTISLPPAQDNETLPHRVVGLDEDGDLILTRKTSKLTRAIGEQSEDDIIMSIQHSITSSIPSVGLQVWKAELALADFVIHKMFRSSDFDGIVAIELGAGTGFIGMLLAHVARAVFLTDHGGEVLDNCAMNVHLNSELFHHKDSVFVRELDWNNSWPPKVVACSSSGQRYAWTASEIEELQRASLLVAADVIYGDDLTDAFFCTLERLMSQGPEKVSKRSSNALQNSMQDICYHQFCKLDVDLVEPITSLVHKMIYEVLYLALEKRYNFTLDDLDVVANGYSHFRSYLTIEEETDEHASISSTGFVGSHIDLTEIPKYVREYERGTDVEIWQIKYDSRRTLI